MQERLDRGLRQPELGRDLGIVEPLPFAQHERVALAARQAVEGAGQVDELRSDATRERLLGAERAVEAVRETWRRLEEFNLAPQLALEALFIRLTQEMRGIG